MQSRKRLRSYTFFMNLRNLKAINNSSPESNSKKYFFITRKLLKLLLNIYQAAVLAMYAITYLLIIFNVHLFAPISHDCQAHENVEIIAHRGGAGMAPENSLQCIEKAIATGADAIEIDIRLTKDEVIVVCHDSNLKRTTNGKGKIEEMTFEEVRSYRILGPEGNATEERVPTLDEVLGLVNGRCHLLIEVKPCKRYKRISELLLKVIEKHNAASWVSAQSFSDNVLFALNALNPPFPLEKLIMCKLPLLPFIIDNGISKFNYSKYSFIASFNFNCDALRSSVIEDVHTHGKKVKMWTLDSPEKAPGLDVDGIITDRPDLWRK